MTELHTAWLTTVLAANTAFEFGTCAATLVYSHLDELAYASLIENLEGVYAEDLLV